jgi:dipeptidyl aminopeptidase/acylaminoacyl peptidase
MTRRQIKAYGSWKSPISSDLIIAGTVGIGQLTLDGETVYWLEMRPTEGGRYAIARRRPDGKTEDVTPPEFNVRTRVHEYGGGAYLVAEETVYFVNFSDQRLYRQSPGGDPEAITPDDGRRYADFDHDRTRQRLIAVREDHSSAGEPVNTIAAISLDGRSSTQVLVAGDDFYSSPRVSPDGSQLCWLSWNHPDMPWDATELWVASLDADGNLGDSQRVAGGHDESIFQPQWSEDGQLYFVGDRSGWWNLYTWDGQQVRGICPQTAEFGLPHWVFGMSTYGLISPEAIACSYSREGLSHLGRLNVKTGELQEIQTPYTSIASLQVQGNRAVFIGGSASEPTAVVQLDLDTGTYKILRQSTTLDFDRAYLSTPKPIAFPTTEGATAYGIFYPPQNPDYEAPEGELPPLLVKSHGGPTASASSTLSLGIQYWTSRGFAVLDVNYRGSTGYGRDYRLQLHGHWGIYDVDDCANGAKYLADRGLVDGDRLAISGGSAGGYTTLCALTFRDTFKAGASHYGVSDLEALAKDTHKFESRYLDKLIGPYPDRRDLYEQRSPIHHCDRLSCPVIFFQGLEDKIVPPNQAETMLEVLRGKGLPVAYVAFEGEQHGFRRGENIKRALDGEFYFYARVFGFDPADAIEPVAIENL